MTRTVVIIHPGALGDVLLSVPAIRYVRTQFPSHHLVLCANEPVARLLCECGEVDAWFSAEDRVLSLLFGGSTEPTGVPKEWLLSCDLAIGWIDDEGGCVASSLRKCGAKDVRVRSPFSIGLHARHQADRFLETLHGQSKEGLPPSRLSLPDRLRERALSYLYERRVRTDQPLVVVHPGSGSRHKCSSPKVFASAMHALQKDGASFLIVEGPADHESVGSLLAHVPVDLTLVQGIDLATLAGVLALSRLFIGHDSGITHLSALLGIQTVALFGPTEPERWAPRGNHIAVTRGDRCGCHSWDTVIQCRDKLCLSPAMDEFVETCQNRYRVVANPRIPSGCTLSQPTPCAKVAS